MNKVQLYGRVSQKSELRETSNGTLVINLSVATGFGDKVTFVPVTVWAKQADIVNHYIEKGDRVIIEGRITANKTIRNDVEFTEHKVTAEFVELVETKADKQGGVAPAKQEPEPKDFVKDSDLPF